MAEHLASIFGTEKDKVNCPFYFKIGACRHGDRCSRQHNRPTFSQTILIQNMYQNPLAQAQTTGVQVNPKEAEEHFEDFYEDVYEELNKFGTLEELNVCDNIADHLVGNVYVKFEEEDHAQAAMQALNGRYYAGRPLLVEYSPVTDFREARCRQYEKTECKRGGYCNFMHLKPVPREMRHRLFKKGHRGRMSRSRSRSRSPGRDRRRRSFSPRDRRGGGRYDDRRGGYEDRYRGGRGGGRDNRDYRDDYRGRDRDNYRGGGGHRDNRGMGDDYRRGGDHGGYGNRDMPPQHHGHGGYPPQDHGYQQPDDRYNAPPPPNHHMEAPQGGPPPSQYF